MAIRSRVLSTVLSCVLAVSAAGVPAHGQACSGCEGEGGYASSNPVSGCDGVVTIEVTVIDGICKPVGTGGAPACWDKKGCTPTVIRTWSGLPAGSELEFCAQNAVETLCFQDQPDAGSGSGSDSSQASEIGCGAWTTYSIVTECGQSAAVTATCSGCELGE